MIEVALMMWEIWVRELHLLCVTKRHLSRTYDVSEVIDVVRKETAPLKIKYSFGVAEEGKRSLHVENMFFRRSREHCNII